MGSLIYFAQDTDTRLVKVGITDHLEFRMKRLGGRRPLKLLATKSGNRGEEKDLHERFAPYRRRGFEWFEPCQELVDLVRELGGEVDGPVAAPRAPRRMPSVESDGAEAFRKHIRGLGLTDMAASRKLGITNVTIHCLVRGKNLPSEAVATLIEGWSGGAVSVALWLCVNGVQVRDRLHSSRRRRPETFRLIPQEPR